MVVVFVLFEFLCEVLCCVCVCVLSIGGVNGKLFKKKQGERRNVCVCKSVVYWIHPVLLLSLSDNCCVVCKDLCVVI